MAFTTHSENRLRDSGPAAAQHLLASGQLEVVRIVKATSTKGDTLEFSGVPTKQGSKARAVRVRFTADYLKLAPRFDAATGIIELFYPHRDHPEVHALLNGKSNRFCYFWRSERSGHTHAWLLSSQ
jgi:hypothetical protein